MHSPFQAVYGHDLTRVKRMTVGEYLQEVDDEERDLRGEAPRGRQRSVNSANNNVGERRAASPPQYELRRDALSSQNPNVVFSSKYPMYDRLGRELCVLYQMQDMAVEEEYQRLRKEGEAGRRSGVRLSAELRLDAATSCVTGVASKRGSRPTCGVDANVDVDVTVSSMSRTSSFMPSQPTSARPSEFSIYRDSTKPGLMLARASAVAAANQRESDRGELGRVSKRVRSLPATTTASSVPIREVAIAATLDSRGRSQPALSPRPLNGLSGANEKESAATSRPECGTEGGRMPLLRQAAPRLRRIADDGSDEGNGGRVAASRSRSQAQKRSREASHARLSRVRFASEGACNEVEVEEEEEEWQERSLDKSAVKEKGTTRCGTGTDPETISATDEDTGGVAQGSPLEEAGEQKHEPPVRLNASTNDMHGHNASIPAIDPVRFTMARESTAARTTKQLFRTTAGATCRGTASLAHPHPISSAAYGLHAGTIPARKVFAEVEQNFAGCGALSGTFVECAAEDTPELRCGRVIRLGDRWYQLTAFFLVAEVYEVVEVDPPAQPDGKGSEASAAPHSTAPVATAPAEGEHAPIQWLPPAHGAASGQLLLYRWRNRHTPLRGNESRRAAAGLGLCAPEVMVSGFAFADGGGLTLLTMPPGYRATPLSGLPLAASSYRTLLRLLLRVLSSMLARRLVHGNLSSLGEILVAFSSADPARDTAATPLLLPVHWERAVDFSMFVDRSAGRTIPFDSEDGSERPLLTLGSDLATVLQCLLEHKQAAELTSSQYVLLQKLIVMAAEPTQVANYLLQINNLMSALPPDVPSLLQAYNAAAVIYES